MILTGDRISVPKSATILEALNVLDKQQAKILVVADENGALYGTCTDGDIRRAIINQRQLDEPIGDICNRSPVSASHTLNSGQLHTMARDKNVTQIPIIDDNGLITGLYIDDMTRQSGDLNVPVVLMAGGLGTRLRPLTENTPKPLLPLGEKPILQHIIERLREQGFKRYYISINYLGHMIEEHFGDGSQLGVEISYVRETKRLGTGGALSLLPTNMFSPFLVMNGDLISDMNFAALVEHHLSVGAAATMCIREHRTSIPFGVVQIDGATYKGVDEKPTLTHYINAGIYCLSKEAKSVVPDDEFYDMPTLFSDLHEANKHCSTFTISNRWIDIGSHSEYEAAQKRFAS